MARTGTGPDFIEALARGLDVIAAFRPGRPAKSLTEVATATGLARPTAIYAAGATDDAEGQRTRETVTPLADALGLPVDTDFGRGDEKKLAEELADRTGTSLVSWQHGGIPTIVDAFPHLTPTPPDEWPDDRFDVVWTLTRTADGWHFAQVPELVLPEDEAATIDD